MKENIPSENDSTHESGGDSPVTSEMGSLLLEMERMKCRDWSAIPEEK